MTLSIAAKYPWGELRKLAVFQRDLPQAIIFVTDSRWTINEHEHKDIGTKFFDITDDSGLVFAGDVQSGENCVTELRKKLQKKRDRSFKESMYTAQQVFQRVYRYHKRNRNTKVYPLYFLIGVCDKAGNASLMSFSSPKFNPLFIEGIYGVGVRKAYADFEKALNDEISKVVKEEFDERSRVPALQKLQVPVKNNAEIIGISIAAIMQTQVVDAVEYSTIGGAIQYAIITRDGIKAPGIYWTKDPTNAATDTWHKITPLPDEITTYKDEYKLRPDFINVSSFGLYQISS